MGINATKGKDFSELKLQKPIKIVEQPDIDLEIDDVDAGGATSRIAERAGRVR